MRSVNEKTTWVMGLTFQDENGEAVQPSAAQYRLDDVASGQQILNWTSFSPSSSSYDLVITDAQNAIINPALEIEKKRLTVSITFGSDSKKATAEYIYAVKNLTKIT